MPRLRSIAMLSLVRVFLFSLLGSLSVFAISQPDRANNVTSDVGLGTKNTKEILPFGSELFAGEFAKQSFSGFNPNYTLNIGDQIDFQTWGGYELTTTLTVDAQGNVFIPQVGPVKVVGVQNSALNNHLLKHLKRVFKKNVNTYAALKTAQPVKVYVTGQVNKPGLYAGLSSDSLLFYVDSAGGINPDTGSYIDIKVKRNGKVLHRVNLYDFLLEGQIVPMQLMDGDIVLIGEKKNTVVVFGELKRASTVEFEGTLNARRLLRLVKPKALASHMRVTHLKSASIKSEYISFNDLDDFELTAGDSVELVSDKRFQTISVRVQGEHDGIRELILPYGASLDKVVADIEFNELSDRSGIQLFRKSVKRRQKEQLDTSLNSLEETVLTARSQTLETAQLRATEAEQILKWIEKARSIEPKGQVILGDESQFKNISLEDGDVIQVPKNSGLVMIHGEVRFPSALSFDEKSTIQDYIEMTGGYSRRGGVSKVLVMHPSGRFTEVSRRKAKRTKLSPNDEVIVLPKVDSKSMQILKDVSQVIYQLALSARVFVSI